MTDTEINIAIAEACGRVRRPDGYWFPEESTIGAQGIPNYCNDLNAMHEAIAFLSPEEADWFAVELSAIVLENPSKSWWDMNSNEVAHIANATANQRAEAFLRTIGKWKEARK